MILKTLYARTNWDLLIGVKKPSKTYWRKYIIYLFTERRMLKKDKQIGIESVIEVLWMMKKIWNIIYENLLFVDLIKCHERQTNWDGAGNNPNIHPFHNKGQ